MNPSEKLKQVKAEYDKSIDALLTGLENSEQEYVRLIILSRQSAAAWADALRGAALEMDYTLQLDTQAEEVPKRLEHLLSFIWEFRRRHQGGDKGDAAGVPAQPILPLKSGLLAKPLE